MSSSPSATRSVVPVGKKGIRIVRDWMRSSQRYVSTWNCDRVAALFSKFATNRMCLSAIEDFVRSGIEYHRRNISILLVL